MMVQLDYKYGECPDWVRLSDLLTCYHSFCNKLIFSKKKMRFKSFADFYGAACSHYRRKHIDQDDLVFLYQEFLRQRFITAV